MKFSWRLGKWLLIIIILSVVFFYSFMFFYSLLMPQPYYAVFLTNGQVYFGHMDHIDNNLITLHDVYYFRTDTNLSTTDLQKRKNVDLHVSLVKLGNEIHEPQDVLYINRTQVLFWEELQGNGKLAQTLQKYNSSQ